MKPAPFEYHRAGSLEEATELLAQHGDAAKVLAGGQSLVPTMNFRLAQPAVLVDLNFVPGLSDIREEAGGVRLGSMTRQRAAERSAVVAARLPLLAEALPFVAHPPIRNRGTIGGSIAHADPAAELPVVMRLHDARFLVRNRAGERWIGAADFFTGLFATALSPDEILADIVVPSFPDGTGVAFDEVARRHGDYALVGVGAAVTLGNAGVCSDVRIGLLSVGDGPVLALAGPEALIGSVPTSENIAEAAAAVAERDIDPPGDIHASANYRRHLAGVLVRRVLERAATRAGADLR